MPQIKHLPPDDVRLNKMLADENGDLLGMMLEEFDKIEGDNALEITLDRSEDLKKFMDAVTSAARVRSIRIKKDSYSNKRGNNVIAVYLTNPPPKSRSRRRPRQTQTAAQSGPNSQRTADDNPPENKNEEPDVQTESIGDGSDNGSKDHSTAAEADLHDPASTNDTPEEEAPNPEGSGAQTPRLSRTA